MEQFRKWFAEASGVGGGRFQRFAIHLYKAFATLLGAKSIEANVMALATTDAEGNPSVRMVLLKGFDSRGFIFYTNYESRKGQELTISPTASLAMHWPELERQVCVTGIVTRVSQTESEEYFNSRPRGSQIGAWASQQSRPVEDEEILIYRWREFEQKFTGKDVPLPPFWGGYVLQPERIEFWQGRPNRMHDRFCYMCVGENEWRIGRLSP
jgi:pyridoxamine 5'-phosphate oxidase